MSLAVPPCSNDVSPEGDFGGESVVRRAAKGQVGDAVFTAPRKGDEMMKLEPGSFAATHPPLIEVAATALITAEYRPLHRGRNLSTAPARC